MADCGLRPKDIDGIATAGETPVQLAHYLGHHANLGGRNLGGRMLVHDPRPPRRGGDRGRACANTILITHGESGRSRIGNPAALRAAGLAERPVRAAVRPDGTAEHVHHSRAAVHEDIRRDRGADRAGFGGAARMGGEEPPRDLQDADHHRRRAEQPHDRVAVPPADVLPRHRRRRRADPDLRRTRGQGFQHEAGLHPRHWERAWRRRWSARWRISPPPARSASPVPRRSKSGRHQRQRRRSSDDLRRFRAPADLRAGGSRLPAARRGGGVHRRTQHTPRAASCR